jgi:hypothetical protein
MKRLTNQKIGMHMIKLTNMGDNNKIRQSDVKNDKQKVCFREEHQIIC